MRVLLGGASGLIGKHLSQFLTERDHEVWRLVRSENASKNEISWDPSTGRLEAQQIENFDAIIHLGGTPLAVRWTDAQKKLIRSSRVESTSLLARTIDRLQRKPRCFVVSSGVGIYGDRGDEILTEASQPGGGFLGQTCIAWEAASRCSVRTVNMRTGLVLAKDGGLLERLLPIFRMGVGGPLGSGKQYMSWIGLPDVVRAFEFVASNPAIEGALNLTAPSPVTNGDFSRALAKSLHRPSFVRVPAFALRLLYGQMAEEALLAGQRAVPQKLLDAGFAFQSSQLEEALSDVI